MNRLISEDQKQRGKQGNFPRLGRGGAAMAHVTNGGAAAHVTSNAFHLIETLYIYYIYPELRIGDCRFGSGKGAGPL